MKKSQPVQVGELVGAILSKLGIDKRSPQARILNIWDGVVGKDVAAHTRPAEIRKGTLIVHVDSSPWFNELNRYYKKEILKKLKEKAGDSEIKDIKFRVGEV